MSKWENFNIGGGGDGLPPPGDYQARILAMSLFDKPDALWMNVVFGLRDHAETVTRLVCIAAEPGSPHARREVEGRRLLNRLAKATGQEIKVTDPDDIPSIFVGRAVSLKVAHKVVDGIAELVVRAITPPKTDA